MENWLHNGSWPRCDVVFVTTPFVDFSLMKEEYIQTRGRELTGIKWETERHPTGPTGHFSFLSPTLNRELEIKRGHLMMTTILFVRSMQADIDVVVVSNAPIPTMEEYETIYGGK